MADNGEIIRLVIQYGIPAASAALNVFTYLIEDGSPSDEDVLDDMDDWTTNNWGVDWADLAAAVCDIIGIAVDVVNTDGTVERNIGSNTLSIPGTVGGEAGVAAASATLMTQDALTDPKTNLPGQHALSKKASTKKLKPQRKKLMMKPRSGKS